MPQPNSIEQIIAGIQPLAQQWVEKARQRTEQLVIPPRALGRLHDIAEQFCAIQQSLSPSIGAKGILIMAGDHGVAAEGVSAFPQEVTGAMVQTFLNGGGGINAIARTVGADVWVVDMGIIPEMDPEQGRPRNSLLSPGACHDAGSGAPGGTDRIRSRRCAF
jgi:nicotinate-nucleotide--dimethylbenzimidazole phosphoribosyltransferase